MIQKIYSIFIVLLKTRSWFWFKKARYYGVPPSDLMWDSSNRSCKITSLDLLLNDHKLLFILKSYKLLQHISNSGIVAISQRDNELLLKYKDLVVPVDSRQEIFIFKEILVDGIYNFRLDDSWVVVDIGFNIGMASLSFCLNGASKVYAFEPLEPTLRKGKEVMSQNPQYLDRIEIFNFGLAGADGAFDVQYDYETKGNIGIGDWKVDSGRFEHIQVKDCFKVLEPIFREWSDKQILLKVDCEGAEYDIFNRLNETGLLSEVDLIVLEFHFQGADILIEILEKNRFQYLIKGEDQQIGLIYAWKKKT